MTSKPEHSRRGGYLLLLGLTCIALLTIVRVRPPAPLGHEAPWGEFSTARAIDALAKILGDEAPHTVSSSANAAVRERIAIRLHELGYDLERQSARGCQASDSRAICADVVNLIAKREGRTDGPVLLLNVHYDSVAAGPGAADAGASVGVALEIASILRQRPPARNTVVFLFNEGEERGLLGAEAFLHEHPLVARIGAVINLEARGVSGPSLMFETGPRDLDLVRAYARDARRPLAASFFRDLYRRLPNDTDLTRFRDRDIPGLNFAFIGGVERYHTPEDNLAHLDSGSFQHHGDQALAAVSALAEIDLANLDHRNAAYFDLFGIRLVVFPENYAWLLGLASLALMAAAGVVAYRRHEMSSSELFGAGVRTLSTLVLPSLLGAAVVMMAGASRLWVAYPYPVLVALTAATLLGVATAAGFFTSGVGPMAAVFAPWLLWVVTATALAFTLPGASVPFLIPAIAGAVANLVHASSPGRGRFFALAACWMTAATWLPYAILFTQMAGFEYGLALTVPAALFATTALATSAFDLAGDRRALTLPLLAVIATSVLIFRLLPSATVTTPRHLTFAHLEDDNSSRLAVLEADMALPSELTALQSFSRVKVPGWYETWMVATASAALPPPIITVVSDHIEANQRHLAIRIRSARGAPELRLRVPGLRSFRIDERSLPLGVKEPTATARFTCIGRTCENALLHLTVPIADLELELSDIGPGLPPGDHTFLHLRQANALPAGPGDITIRSTRTPLPAPRASP